jgi:hypothetical protein
VKSETQRESESERETRRERGRERESERERERERARERARARERDREGESPVARLGRHRGLQTSGGHSLGTARPVGRACALGRRFWDPKPIS